jgi:uncharacterized membrane protein YeiH
VTAAFAGAVVAVTLTALGTDLQTVLIACGVATFVLRAGSLAFGWRLPVYKARPPRPDAPKR